MDEILALLADGARVLDLGSGAGSFRAPGRVRVVRADIVVPAVMDKSEPYVVCSADRLPFRAESFDALILHHSLEHFHNLGACLKELGRVAAPGCALYLSVPDASTLTDRIYRWLGRGGGHVNPFVDPDELASSVSRATGLRHSGTRTLRTSLSFLNRRTAGAKRPRRMIFFLGGWEPLLRWLTYLWRRCDEVMGTRFSVYGWSMYFGPVAPAGGPEITNVCIRCGAGHPAAWLKEQGLVRLRRWLPGYYHCPACGTRNYFTHDPDL